MLFIAHKTHRLALLSVIPCTKGLVDQHLHAQLSHLTRTGSCKQGSAMALFLELGAMALFLELGTIRANSSLTMGMQRLATTCILEPIDPRRANAYTTGAPACVTRSLPPPSDKHCDGKSNEEQSLCPRCIKMYFAPDEEHVIVSATEAYCSL